MVKRSLVDQVDRVLFEYRRVTDRVADGTLEDKDQKTKIYQVLQGEQALEEVEERRLDLWTFPWTTNWGRCQEFELGRNDAVASGGLMRTKIHQSRFVSGRAVEKTASGRRIKDGGTEETGVDDVGVEVEDDRRFDRGLDGVDGTANELEVRGQSRGTAEGRFNTCKGERQIRDGKTAMTETGDHRSDNEEQLEDQHGETSAATCLFCEETMGAGREESGSLSGGSRRRWGGRLWFEFKFSGVAGSTRPGLYIRIAIETVDSSKHRQTQHTCHI